MISYPDGPLKPILHDLHYALRPKKELANELEIGTNNLIQGRLENARSHAMYIDQQVVNGMNSDLGQAFNFTKQLTKRLHDAINQGLDRALRKTGTLEHRAQSQSDARGHALPPALRGPDLEAALQLADSQQSGDIQRIDREIKYINVTFHR